MLLIDNLKPLKIYRKPMFLPTVDDNKKKKSAIFLLTPNYESSKKLMQSDLLINKLRFQSYYIEKDLTYFISSKVMNKVDDVTETYVHDYSEIDFYHSLCEMSTSERNKLKDSDFGLPKKRKYPLTDKSHVKSAIKFFNYVDSEDEAELAKNIKSKMKKYNISSNSVGDKNRLKMYLTESATSSVLDSLTMSTTDENGVKMYYFKDSKGNTVCSFGTAYSDWNKDKWLINLDVDSKYRRQGYGTACVRYAIDKLGCSYLKVRRNNTKALNLYKKLGFENDIEDSKFYFMRVNKSKYNKYKSTLHEDVGTTIDTVVFDLGDVLVTYDYKTYMENDPDIPDEFVEEIFNAVTNVQGHPFETCTFDEGVKLYEDALRDDLKQYARKAYLDYHECIEVLDYTEDLLSSLKNSGYKLYYLSNWDKVGVAIEKQRGVFSFLEYFDGGIFSCDAGCMKPDRKIYEMLQQRYGLQPERIVFFDDKEENIEAAKTCGWNTVIFTKDIGRRLIGGDSIEDIIGTTSNSVGFDTPAQGRCVEESSAIERHIYDLVNSTLDGVYVDVNNSDEFCPVKISNIPNYMGINLCNVQSIEWSRLPDDQLVDIVVKFIPEGSTEMQEATYILNEASEITHTSDKTLYNWIMKNTNYKSNGIYDTNKIENAHEGDCHDFAGYQYYWLKKLGYKTGRLFMVEYSKWNSPGGKTHTACWYVKNNKYYWMETAWGGMEGIHECGSSLSDVKNLIKKNWKFSGKNDRLYMGNVHGVKNGMTLNEYVNACTPEKEDKNYYEKGRVIKESYEIERERGFYHYDGTYNCIVQVKGIEKPLRGRGEILILDKTYSKIYLVPDGDKYKVPGGGFEPNESHLDGTVREAKEEARIEVVGAYDTGVRYVEMFKDNPDVSQKEFDPKNRFYGFYTEVFIGIAASHYDGELDTLDVDNKMRRGHFYDIEKVYDKLIPEHKQALQIQLKDRR